MADARQVPLTDAIVSYIQSCIDISHDFGCPDCGCGNMPRYMHKQGHILLEAIEVLEKELEEEDSAKA